MTKENKSKAVQKLWPDYFQESEKQKITHEHLIEQAFMVNGLDEYFDPKTGITVKRKTTKSGKVMFTCNDKIVKFMIELYS